ncbi:hypothetical protein A8B78_16985 [Jannaschia sp. EhC01]|nr:hypothetical protein A8B78_16985 [Jannaschia sp. EhC01]
MSFFLLVLLGAAAGLALGEVFSDDDNDTSGDTPVGDEDMGEIVRVDTALGFTGSDEADVFTFDPDARGAVVTSIDAGAGDDIIDLASLFGDPALVGSDVQGGAGDDLIEVQGDGNTISGGEGDDTISAELFASTVTGDAGDDLIRVTNISADATNVDGGEGNDTIDVTGSDNINVTGGAGDDLLISDGRTIVGTGYAIDIDGGAGDDTLAHSVDVFPLPLQDPSESAAILTGGDGADTFDISLTTGNGVFSETAQDPEVFVNQAARIMDFERGTDILSVEIPSSLTGYTAESGTLAEDTTAGTTTITISLTGDLPTQDVQIIVSATGLTWGDVTFSDQAPATLTVA